MTIKNYKTIDEQIDILISRGLTIPDREKAFDFLQKNNYYRISGYSLTLRKHDVFSKHATFQNIIDIYEFDHELRHILLKHIETVEVTVKSVYSHEFTKKYGAIGYLDKNNFTDFERHRKIIEKAEEQKNSRIRHEAYLKHFVDELQQDIPLWAYVDLLTISDISILYSISSPELKKTVASILGFNKRGDEVLGRFMHSITIIRNLCAHGSRLYNRLFEQKPWLNKKELALLSVNQNGSVDNAHLYGFILIMKRLLSAEDFDEMKTEIINLSLKYPFVCMCYYGFRKDWKDVL